MKKIFDKVTILLVICSMIISTGISKVDASSNSLYNLYTKTLVSDSIKYLNEVYLKKYPNLGLTLKYGTLEEKAIIKNLAKDITKNSKTDLEKSNAIYNWILKNIKFSEKSSAYSMDALYEKKGHCMSYSNLMTDMLKSIGIKCAVVGGIGEDMTKETTVDGLSGHYWVMAYIDSKWTLYDVAKRVKAETNIDTMAKKYYFSFIDFVFIDNFCSKKYNHQVTYNNGFKVLNTEEDYIPNVAGSYFNDIPVAFATNKHVKYVGDFEEFNCPEEAKNNVFNGGLAYIENEQSIYSFENGIISFRNELMINNKKCLTLDSGCFIVNSSKAPYYFIHGGLTFKRGDTVSIVKIEVADSLDKFQVEWKSSNPSIIKVLDDNKLQCLKNGKTDLTLTITNKKAGVSNIWPITVYVGNGRPSVDFTYKSDDSLTVNKLKTLKVKIKKLKNKKKNKLYIKWKKISGVDGYQIAYAINKKFTKKKKTKKSKKTSITLKKLKKKKYYVKVRAYKKVNNKIHWSKWSKIKLKKIKK